MLLPDGLYAHRHDDDGLKWWYWADDAPDNQSPLSLWGDDPRIPCKHLECPSDHVHEGNGDFTYDAGGHYFVGVNSHRAVTYTYVSSDGKWRIEGRNEMVDAKNGPCIHNAAEHQH